MSYFSGNVPGQLEEWEQQEGRYISTSLGTLTHRQRMTILMSLGLVTAIEISNRISINVLLPDLQGNVAADVDQVSWVVILYNLGFLISLTLATWMTRVFGARRHLLTSIGFYAAGAFGCFLSARSLESLLVSRLIMGFGGGAFLVRTVILAGLMFPGKARIKAVSWLYGILAFFEVTYPPTMGWISDNAHWNYAFLIDFPFLIVGTYMVWKHVPKGFVFRRPKQSQIDLRGALLLIASLGCLQVATSRGERDLWFESSWIGPTLLLSLVCFLLFLWWDSRYENESPVFHLRTIWRQPSIRNSLLVVLMVGAILGGGLYVIPQYLRYVQDYSAMQTGGFISMYTLGLGLGLVISLNFILPKIGGPLTLTFGLMMMIVTCITFIYIWTPTTPARVLAPAILLQGLSLAPTILAAANVATTNVAPVDLNDVQTAYFFLRQLGNTFGVTAVTVLFDRRMTFHSSRMLDLSNKLDPTVTTTLSQYAALIHRNGGGGSIPSLGALQLFQADVITQSRLLSYIDIYFGLGAIAAMGLLFLILARIKSDRIKHYHFHPW